METISKGIFLKKVLQFDENSIKIFYQKPQFPISFMPIKWIGFIGNVEADYEFNDKLCYFKNKSIFGKTTLYISHCSVYDQIPISEEQLSEDDKDDLIFHNLKLGDTELDEDDYTKDNEDKEKKYPDLYLRTQTIQLRLSMKKLKVLYGYLEKSSSQKANYAKDRGLFSLNTNCLAYTDDWAFYVKSKIFGDSEIDSVPIKTMAFFLKTRSVIPFYHRCGVYCGYHRQLEAKKLLNDEANKFKAWCYERASRLSNKGESFTSSIWPKFYNLWSYIHRDHISLTDEAIVYNRNTFGRDEMVYVPYSRINIFLCSKGLFTKRMEIYGEQNIIPKFSFKKSFVLKIKKIIEEKGVKSAIGKSYSSSKFYFRNWFGRAPRLVTTEMGILYYPHRLKEANRSIVYLEKNNIEKVIWYKKFFSWTGTLVITGTYKNIREDQSNTSFSIVIPDLMMFNYKYLFLCFPVSGSLRGYLKNTSAEFSRKYDNY